MSETQGDLLREKAEEFAADLTNTVRAAFGDDVAPFTATGLATDKRARFTVSQNPAQGIELRVAGKTRLRLKVEFWCCLDSASAYLAVDDASIRVVMPRERGEPLFRYEYLREQEAGLPSAHLHVHAFREELTHLLLLTGEGSPRGRRRRDAAHRGETPRMHELHFPLGGHRFRPCLEDVLQMIVEEFGVDTAPGADEALREGRETWRRGQTGASVRDAPEEAARVLRSLGYDVQAPAAGPPADNQEKLRAY